MWHKECEKSFADIKSYVIAKTALNNEDEKLTRLMESVIPHHLAGRMREDILNNRMSDAVFNRIYLDAFDNVR